MKRYRRRRGVGGLNLAFDRFLSWSFITVFGITLAVTALLFITLVYGFKFFGSDVSLVRAFIQLTNPTEWHSEGLTGWNAGALVILNLFGMFVVNGLVLTFLINWVSGRRDKSEKGQARYPNVTAGKFTVIIGGHRIVHSLVHNIFKDEADDSQFILIQTQSNVERLRKEIFAEIADSNLRKHIIIYSGDRTSWHELADLRLERARAVYIVGESPIIDGTSHDALNLKCWKLINSNIKGSRDPGKKTPCHIMFEYQSTFTAFQMADLRAEDSAIFRFIPFSIYETWAQQVLVGQAGTGSPYIPLDGTDGLSVSSHQRVHLIIIGMSKTGMAMALQAAHIAHYPNFDNPHAGRPRTLITFIDRNARREMLFMMGRYREIFQLARWRYVKAPEGVKPGDGGSWKIYDSQTDMNALTNADYPWERPLDDPNFKSPYYGGYLGEDFIDIDFEFIEGDVAQPAVQRYIADACADCSANAPAGEPDSSSRTTVAVCLPRASEAISAAFCLDPSVYDNAQQILVEQSETGALVDAVRQGLTGDDSSKYRLLRPFGMLDNCNYPPVDDNFPAKCVAYAYHCMSKKSELVSFMHQYRHRGAEKFIADIEAFWLSIEAGNGKSAVSKRWSNFYCALTFSTKMRAAGSHGVSGEEIVDKATVERLAHMEHTRWLFEQLLLGFRPIDKSMANLFPFNDDNDPGRALRKSLKSKGIHPDLVANSLLSTTDAYDRGIVSIIPVVIELNNKRKANR